MLNVFLFKLFAKGNKMLDLAASTLLFIGYVVLLQVGKNSTVTSAGYSTQETCPSGALEQVYTSWPPCRPRKILVKLPIPDDSDVIEVIPSMAEVTRCGGVCHEGNLYHKCVPKIGARRQKNVMAVFRKRGDEMTCSNIEIEEHTDCKCGCDIEASNCTPQQTYDHYYCKCRCTNLEDRRMCLLDRGRKVWDESQCRCLCRLEEYRECSTGFVYDPVETCSCHENLDGTRTQHANFAMTGLMTALFLVLCFVCGYLYRQNKKLRKKCFQNPPPASPQAKENSDEVSPLKNSIFPNSQHCA